ncbi:hypothetical protein BG51_06790 [Pseudomonas [fluorescens] ATCC 17400]
MEPLFLTGTRTPLYPHTKRIVELLDNSIIEKIQKWRMFSALWELEIDDFHGRKISYKGIRFTGSPEMVFWCYFQPFFEHEIPKVLTEIEKICLSKNLLPADYVTEAADLLKVMVSRLWKEIALTHQMLKGNGEPKAEDLRDMSGAIQASQAKIDDEAATILFRGSPHGQPTIIDDMIEVKPNFMGIGVNLNAVARWIKSKLKNT